MEIRTDRLILRPIRTGDEKEIHEYAGDKDITMMFWLPNDTFEETVDFVKKNAEEWNSVEAILEASLGKFAYIEVQLWYRPMETS